MASAVSIKGYECVVLNSGGWRRNEENRV